jgi:hypothetical protein
MVFRPQRLMSCSDIPSSSSSFLRLSVIPSAVSLSPAADPLFRLLRLRPPVARPSSCFVPLNISHALSTPTTARTPVSCSPSRRRESCRIPDDLLGHITGGTRRRRQQQQTGPRMERTNVQTIQAPTKTRIGNKFSAHPHSSLLVYIYYFPVY